MMKKANNMNKARLVRPVSQRLLHAGMAELEGALAPSPFSDLGRLVNPLSIMDIKLCPPLY